MQLFLLQYSKRPVHQRWGPSHWWLWIVQYKHISEVTFRAEFILGMVQQHRSIYVRNKIFFLRLTESRTIMGVFDQRIYFNIHILHATKITVHGLRDIHSIEKKNTSSSCSFMQAQQLYTLYHILPTQLNLCTYRQDSVNIVSIASVAWCS